MFDRRTVPTLDQVRGWRVRMALLLLTAGAADLRGQDSTAAAAPSGWMVGASLGMLGSGTQTAPLELTTIGLHFTQMRRGAIGADISIGTVPRALAEGFVVLGMRIGVTTPLSLTPGVVLLPSAGVTLVGAGNGGGGAGGAMGFNLGGAAVIGTGPVGFRTGMTWHQLTGTGSGFWLLELGVASNPFSAKH